MIAHRLATFCSATLAALVLVAAPASARNDDVQSAFDSTFGTALRAPQSLDTLHATNLEARIADLANPARGRIGVAAVDLTTGEEVMLLGDQLFPMASTSKVAVAATYLEMVDRGQASLSSEYALLLPVASAKFSSPKAPVRPGNYMQALDLIEIMITRSSNPATDSLLAAVGGPSEVNGWMRRHGFKDFSINRDIATLVRDDGEVDPATRIDPRDAATPRTMVKFLQGLYRGDFLSPQSRQVLLSAMSRTVTGKRRIPALMPYDARVSHKTGSLNNTSSDIGLIETPDGRTIAVAIYVTGQGTRAAREAKIAEIARALYDGFAARAQESLIKNPNRTWTSAPYGVGGQ
ncbi:serine hydrolase [Erythrobacter sp. T5W1-R]|uniref:serine hydrolase n=1 Tax=Erythrobacter sp. T5W1-R TaxID=3101752 RepID=UPI002AFE2E88|nr:serine hydrolase [Erythrobacter sp. T5W1-R]MEA1618555.1 serine hydrolase [Erythrobacter sp. T5W1-R]